MSPYCTYCMAEGCNTIELRHIGQRQLTLMMGVHQRIYIKNINKLKAQNKREDQNQ